VLVAPGTGGTVAANTRLIDQSQGTFEGGPTVEKFVPERLEGGIDYFLLHKREYST